MEALAESVAAPIYEVSFQCYVVLGLAGLILSVLASSGAGDAARAPDEPPPPGARHATASARPA